ncbi:hypothetical protein ACP4OV_023852 [Aristida adscensionis]
MAWKACCSAAAGVARVEGEKQAKHCVRNVREYSVGKDRSLEPSGGSHECRPNGPTYISSPPRFMRKSCKDAQSYQTRKVFLIALMTIAAARASSPDVGSSMKMIEGLATSSTAISSRMTRALVKWDCQLISYSLTNVERLECICKLLHRNVSKL